MAYDFTGKIVLVTAGMDGIGRAVADRFSVYGATVYVTSRSERPASHEADNLHVITLDGTDPEGWDAALRTIQVETGRCVDILINNTGINAGSQPHSKQFMQKLEDELRTNVMGTALGMEKVGAAMCERGGCIINVASVKAYEASASIGYGASKASIVQMTKSYAKLYAPRGIRVNAVSPGITETAMIAGMSKQKRAEYRSMIALQRFATPSEIANAVSFLASSDASYITGTTISVDGGYKL